MYIIAKDFDNAVRSLIKATKITNGPSTITESTQLQNSKYEQQNTSLPEIKGGIENLGSLKCF